MSSVGAALQRTPEGVRLPGTLWDGKALFAYLDRQFVVDLDARANGCFDR